MSLECDLKSLSDAHGPKALSRAFGRLQGSIRLSRKAASRTWGVLAQTFVEAMRIWDGQKVDGVLKSTREADLEKTLRAAWPQVRAWKYLCETCRDSGLEIIDCPGDTTCGRGKPHLSHEFGRPCWCKAGIRFREKPRPVEVPSTRSKPTRLGR
jgi:hypothetical protein